VRGLEGWSWLLGVRSPWKTSTGQFKSPSWQKIHTIEAMHGGVQQVPGAGSCCWEAKKRRRKS